MEIKSSEKTQVTVRISADLVAHIDHLVETGQASSRAAYLDHAARRQRQLEVAERDAAILLNSKPDDDEISLTRWFATRVHPELD